MVGARTRQPDSMSSEPPSAPDLSRHSLVVTEEEEGLRLDRVLAARLADAGLSRSRLKALLEQGCVTAGGATIDDASRRVKSGERFDIQVPDAIEATPRPQAIDLVIVYEDAELLVIDKPAGLVVHPGAGNPEGTLVNALLAYCGDQLSGIGGVKRPGIVHRLDKDTSGLMVVAKNDRAHHALSAQFADRTLSRTYHAVLWGRPPKSDGEVEGLIGRSPTDRKRMAVVNHGGKAALTYYRVLKRFGLAASLVECRLATGRTHQIRVHMASVGSPVVGDPLYGHARSKLRLSGVPEPVRRLLLDFPRQALHAMALQFAHPVSGKLMEFNSKLPEDMEALVASLESL
jgi:23S rRNA pseudouridine1911/1915/1917 synthase